MDEALKQHGLRVEFKAGPKAEVFEIDSGKKVFSIKGSTLVTMTTHRQILNHILNGIKRNRPKNYNFDDSQATYK